MAEPYGFYEFFAGGGMARLGLGPKWRCLLANEWLPKKAESYRINHQADGELLVCDVADIRPGQVPQGGVLSWASFPCQDLSLAGAGRGLSGRNSGTFRPFWKLMADLAAGERPVPIVVLENVVGALNSNQGRDFVEIVRLLGRTGYRVGPLVIDAARFLPQSRPRLFVIAVWRDLEIPPELIADRPSEAWNARGLQKAFDSLDRAGLKNWLWWNPAQPPARKDDLSSYVSEDGPGSKWHSAAETEKIIGMMSEANLEKLDQARKQNRTVVGTVFKRTRRDPDGRRVQRAEVRFDQVCGCLRTPAGGSSRQIVIFVTGSEIRTRLMTPREAASLMGLSPSYILPTKPTEAYHLVGDGLVVPVVKYLSENLLLPLAESWQAGLGRG